MKQRPRVRRVVTQYADQGIAKEPEPTYLFDDEDEANEVAELSSQFLKPLPNTFWVRILGQIFIALGTITLLIGLFLSLNVGAALESLARTIGQPLGNINALGVLFGSIFILYSLPTFAVGAILLSLADLRTELAQSRKILAAMLETQLAIFEKS